MDTSSAVAVSPPGAVSCSSGEMGGSGVPTTAGPAPPETEDAWGVGVPLSPIPRDRWAAASVAAAGAAAPSRAT
nr:hypothetical protein [Human alphaherpesvirus 2]